MRRRRRRSSQGDRIVRHTELAARPLEGPNVGGSSGDKRWPSAAQNISIPGISVSPFAKTGESVLNFRSKSRAPCFVKEPRFPKDGLLSNYQGPQAAAHVVFQIDVHKSSIATHVGSWICSTNRHVYIYIHSWCSPAFSIISCTNILGKLCFLPNPERRQAVRSMYV